RRLRCAKPSSLNRSVWPSDLSCAAVWRAVGPPTQGCPRASSCPGQERQADGTQSLGQITVPGQLLVWAVGRRRFRVGASPTRQIAPAGSNRSSHGGNEVAEAYG